MSTSFGLAKWLRRLGGKSNQSKRARSHRRQRAIRLERLESRYVLTAPHAVDDEIHMTFADPPATEPRQVLQNDTPSSLTVSMVSGVRVDTFPYLGNEYTLE